MKITLEPYSGGEFTATNDAEHILEVVQLFKGLLVSAGYHPNTVDEYFNTDETWFMESDDEVKPSLFVPDEPQEVQLTEHEE